MNRFASSFSRRASLFALVLALFFLLAIPASTRAQQFVIGSSNTVTADPPVVRPHGKSCTVQLFSGQEFADFNIKDFSYTPPSDCPGPWEKIIFTADFNVTAGRQFDRTAVVDLGFVNIYFGTTPEPRQNLAPTWHVERDETDYSALFTTPQTGHTILGNLVNSTFTGIITGSAQLEFFSRHGKSDRDDATRTADVVLPLTQTASGGGINEPAFLFTSTDQLATTFTLPQNIERAFLDVITQSQANDEFWYTCVPNDVATELQSCGNTGFREAEISIDGQPAGVAPVYPWVFTGGIDPFLWEPIPGVQTLNFVPFRVDLTPFAGVLSNGQQHTVALSVFNADNHFSATSTLLLFLDHNSQQVTGEVTENTIGSGPNPTVNENLQTDASGDVTGSVSVTSSREFKLAGFVNTSHGRIHTEVRQSVAFNNTQNFTINATQFIQDISQNTKVTSRTFTSQGFFAFESAEEFKYPFTFNIAVNVAADGSATQQSTASQEFKHEFASPLFASLVDNKVNTTDTLKFNSSGALTGNTDAKSSQTFKLLNTQGQEYSCTLTSASNALTSASEGCGKEPRKGD